LLEIKRLKFLKNQYQTY